MRRREWAENGQVLAGVILLVMVLLIIVPAIVNWVQQDSRASVRDRKNTLALNLAEAGVERAYWKLKGSTTTWWNALNGVPIAGYANDVIYTDVPGGAYRVTISSASGTVQILAEGRDDLRKEKRSVRVDYINLNIPGAIISGAGINMAAGNIVHWGPVLAIGDITLTGGAASRYFPRKYSRGTISPRDTSLDPPNTDNLEWWSAYAVPELPIFDFSTLRSSAAATGTLNCNGTANGGNGWTIPCGSTCTNCSAGSIGRDGRALLGYVWYWDNNVSWSGQNAIKGTVIVRGNMTITGNDDYNPPAVNVPDDAWQEYQKIDTSATNEYPGDNGYQSSASTYDIGSCGTSCEGNNTGSNVNVYGFMYVGGTLTASGGSDYYGAVWVQGGWSGGGNAVIFYDDSLSLPQLNVTIEKTAWQEVTPVDASW